MQTSATAESCRMSVTTASLGAEGLHPEAGRTVNETRSSSRAQPLSA